MRRINSSRFFRLAVATTAAALVVGLSAPMNASAATTATNWDTYSSWDGTSMVYPFGNPQTSTYGQTFTAPSGTKKLKKFAFYMAPQGTAGTMLVRGELYGWDAATARATTPIWESKAMKVTVDPSQPTYNPYKFKPGKKGKIKAGQTYVMFLSISKDYEQATPNATMQWAANYSDVLPGGDIVFLNDDGDESQWTTASWSTFTGFDFALKATLK